MEFERTFAWSPKKGGKKDESLLDHRGLGGAQKEVSLAVKIDFWGQPLVKKKKKWETERARASARVSKKDTLGAGPN